MDDVNFESTDKPPSTGPTYDAAYMLQLKATSARRPLAAGELYDADISMDIDSPAPAQLSALSSMVAMSSRIFPCGP